MLILDLWCGTKSATQAFEDHGDEVVSLDIMPPFQPTICRDILDVDAEWFQESYDRFDFIWASPDCSVFSVANLHSGHFKLPDPTPRTDKARAMIERVAHTRQLITDLDPKIGFLIENPRGLLRKLPVLRGLPRRTVTYCSYGDTRMKPTDLWGPLPGWAHEPPCRPENPNCDHERSPAGTHVGGTSSLDWEDRIQIPYALSEAILEACLAHGSPEQYRTLERWSL